MKLLFIIIFLALFTMQLQAVSIEERVAALEKEVQELKATSAVKSKTAPIPTPAADAGILKIRIFNKRFQGLDFQSGVVSEGVFWDMEIINMSDKRIRAIKGKLTFTDLFDDEKVNINVTLPNQIDPKATIIAEGIGMRYNQYMANHDWLKTTALTDMKYNFKVIEILYRE